MLRNSNPFAGSGPIISVGRAGFWRSMRLACTLFHPPAWNSYCLVGSLASSAALRLQPNAAGARSCPPEARTGGASGLGTAWEQGALQRQTGHAFRQDVHARQLSSRLLPTGWHRCSCRTAWWVRCRRAAAAAGCREGPGQIEGVRKSRQLPSCCGSGRLPGGSRPDRGNQEEQTALPGRGVNR